MAATWHKLDPALKAARARPAMGESIWIALLAMAPYLGQSYLPCWSRPCSNSSERRQDNLRCQWNLGDRSGKRPQRIVDCIGYRSGGSSRAGLACALGTQLRFRRRRYHVAHIYIGHFARHRHQVIGHIGVGELAPLIVNAFLEQRCAEPLHHAAPDLLVNQLRVDDGAAILHDPVPEQLDEPGVDVDLEPRGLNAVREGKRIFTGYVMP